MVEGVFARMPNLEKMAALVHLAGAVAHELNNIFTAVTGNLSLLDEHIERGSAPSEMIGEAIRTAQRGIALSAKLQAFAGRQPLRRKQIDVNRILRGIACDLRNDLPKTVELIFLPASSDCQSFADEDKLRHTILELGANAVAARILALAERSERANNLLRTRVDIALESQNQNLLRSMDRRARQQLLLQETVEGLSVVAISYYLVSLLSKFFEGLSLVSHDLQPMFYLFAVPAVLLVVWLGLRRLRKRLKD